MDIRADPVTMRISQMFGNDKDWWVEHITWYDRIKNTDIGVECLDNVFGALFFDLFATPLMSKLDTVYYFWRDHPELEELLCK